jgi:diaminopimelate decarboxylase
MVLNGWPKTEEQLRLAIHYGVKVFLDGVDEFDMVARVARELEMPVKLGIRTRLMLHALDDIGSDWPGAGTPTEGYSVGENLREQNKGGISEADIPELYRLAAKDRWLDVGGLHFHVGRIRGDTIPIAAVIAEQTALAGRLRHEFRWRPRYLDFGGGVPAGRPEGHGPGGRDTRTSSYDDYARDITSAFLDGITAHDLGRPRLLIEPGRGLATNIGLLLTRVKGLKQVPETDQTWVGVDASLTHLVNALTGGWRYHPVPVLSSSEPLVDRVNIVDRQPWYGNLAFSVRFPSVEVGDALAFLDTGAYCETKTMDFNMVLRPATVLVSGSDADLIARRETLADRLERIEIPKRLLGETSGEAISAGSEATWPSLPTWAPAIGP